MSQELYDNNPKQCTSVLYNILNLNFFCLFVLLYLKNISFLDNRVICKYIVFYHDFYHPMHSMHFDLSPFFLLQDLTLH